MVDTIRTQADLLTFLHPNIQNAMPDATVLQSQSARDLITSIPFLGSGAYSVITTASESAIQTAMTNASAQGGGTVIVAGGLGAVPITTGLQAKSNVTLIVLPGSYLNITGTANITVLSYSGSSTSAGVAMTGTVTQFTDTGTLSSGTEGMAVDSVGWFERNGTPWQLLRAKSVSGSTLRFYDTFAWSFSTLWTFKRLINPLVNFKFSGEIRNTSNTNANSTAINIQGFVGLNISDAIVTGFTQAASQIGIYLTRGLELTMKNVHMEQCGNYNNTAGLWIASCTKVYIDTLSIDNLTAQPTLFAECCDGSVQNFFLAGGGRSLEIDTLRRFVFKNGLIMGDNTLADDCIAVESQPANVGGMGTAFNSAYLYFDKVQGYNAAGFGLNLFGDGSGPNYYFDCVFLQNNVDVSAAVGDLATYFRDVEYSTSQLTNIANLYISKVGALTYVPTITQSGAPAITWNIADFTHRDNSALVELHGSITATGGAVGNNAIVISLPFNALAAYATREMFIGSGLLTVAATGFVYPFFVKIAPGNGSVVLIPSAVAGAAILALGQTGSGYNAALAAGDTIKLNMEYRRL